jgi:hypothetical protein
MISTHISCDHNTYHIRFRDTWLQREKEATRQFTFQPKALEMFENQYNELALAVDLIAERIRSLGCFAPGTYHEFSRMTVIKEDLMFVLPVGLSKDDSILFTEHYIRSWAEEILLYEKAANIKSSLYKKLPSTSTKGVFPLWSCCSLHAPQPRRVISKRTNIRIGN